VEEVNRLIKQFPLGEKTIAKLWQGREGAGSWRNSLRSM